MRNLRYLLITLTQTLLRMLPFPCRTGLVKIGNPGRNSPVLLTGNFRLTVERVRRALDGIDAYLLVANSRGINVWCAATGGYLTNHDVISVLKTSGIEELVDHREVILPQLAATGIEGGVVHRRSCWRVVWGPVYARSIPDFLGARRKTPEMSTVRFAWPQRLEMAVAWAFPISLMSLLLLPFWRAGVLPLIGIVWGAAFAIFLSFPLYEAGLHKTRKNVGFVFFDFGKQGAPVFLWLLFMAGLVGYSIVVDEFSWGLAFRWGLSSLIVLLILGLDLMGSTPTYKSGLHEERLLRIDLSIEQCRGAGSCEEVCPTGVFRVDHERRLAFLAKVERCVQCGACIVQCPFDALRFRSPKGDVVEPETIRRFKLNMLGRRKVRARSVKAE